MFREHFLTSGPLKRDNYAKLPDVVEKDNVARKLLKPLYGLSTACKDRYGAVRDVLDEWRVCGGGSYIDG